MVLLRHSAVPLLLLAAVACYEAEPAGFPWIDPAGLQGPPLLLTCEGFSVSLRDNLVEESGVKDLRHITVGADPATDVVPGAFVVSSFETGNRRELLAAAVAIRP